MQSGFALALVWVFVGSISRVAAQAERIETPIGPLGLAAMRAATQLASKPASLPAQPAEDPHQADWSRVRALEAATDITLTVTGAVPVQRSFVRADDTTLTVLNLTDPSLPRVAVQTLRIMLTANRPQDFATSARTFIDREVRFGPGGLFVADRKVADFGQIVERIARSDIVVVAIPLRVRGSLLGAGIGAGIGVWVGYRIVAFSTLDCPYGGHCIAVQVRRAAPAWLPVAFGLLGYQASQHTVGGEVYRAP